MKWEREGKIIFIESSADKFLELFKETTFDIIFANRVFYHFIKESWRKILLGINDIMYQISAILKSTDYFVLLIIFMTDGYFTHQQEELFIYWPGIRYCFFVSVLYSEKLIHVCGCRSVLLSQKMWHKIFKENNLRFNPSMSDIN